MDNCVQSSKKLLDLIGVNYTDQYLEDCILSHPDHPSLLCISDTLEKYGVDALAIKVEADKLLEFPLPCIIQLSNRGGVFKVLENFSKERIVCIDDKGKPVELNREQFLSKWTGICLLAKASKNSKEPGMEKRLQEKRAMSILQWGTVALLITSLILTLTNSDIAVDSNTVFLGVYTSLKIIGLVVGVLLLWYEVDKYNPALQSFCSGGSKINCEAVLGSKYAKLFNGNLSLSLVGFAYFFGSLSFLGIMGFSPVSVSIASLLSFTALPMVLLSIYYQAIIIKQWCKFCIIVQAVLILEMTIAYFDRFYATPFVWEALPLLLGLLLLPIPIWKILRPLFEAKKDTNLYRRSLKKIKNNPNVLTGLLAKTRKVTTGVKGLGISINNKNAKYHIIKVCNPYCGPCAKAHPILEELVNKGIINLQILFTASAETTNPRTKTVSHLLAIDEKGDKGMTRQALDDWYLAEKKDYESFAQKYPMNGEPGKQLEKIGTMKKWCDTEKITHTPTIFINGHELPREYSVEDLSEVLS